MLVRIPKNDAVLKAIGPYPSYLNVLREGGTAVQRRLTRRGLAGYEKPTQATILALMEIHLGKRMVFYDVGAHIGLYSAMVCSIYRMAGAVAFEPTPRTAVKAVRLRDKNRLNYHIAQFAASSEAGEVEFYLSTRAETSNSMNAGFRPGSASIRVKTDTIDNYVAAGAPPPSVMKVDVETFEATTLAGAKGVIERHRPWIVCEILPEADRKATEDLITWLSAFNYRFYPINLAEKREAVSLEQLTTGRSHKQRDWIIAPDDLPDAFDRSLERWAAAIEASGPDTNVISDDKLLIRKSLKQRWTSASDGDLDLKPTAVPQVSRNVLMKGGVAWEDDEYPVHSPKRAAYLDGPMETVGDIRRRFSDNAKIR